ncbi:MAG: hypothetical protein AAGG75_26745 [Bacteroidota bacterium]
MKKGLLFCALPLLALLLFQACQPAAVELRPAFYHWQTRLVLSDAERRYLQDLKVERLYVKFFDVDRPAEGQETRALAQLQRRGALPPNLEIIPTIFITNRSLRGCTAPQIDSLHQRIYRKVGQLWKQLPEYELKEVQIDCDWSGQTREAYFSLLRQLRQKWRTEGVALSTTIRLHQLKYPGQTGVPPADRGMLMCYNVGDVKDSTTRNSILDNQIVQRYIEGARRYPLELDMALPIFAWGVLYRDGQMIKLLNNLRSEQLAADERFVKSGEKQFRATKSTYLKGQYLYEGDEIRCEAVTAQQLQESAELLAPLVHHSPLTLSFYHLDTTTIKYYPYETLEAICKKFQD